MMNAAAGIFLAARRKGGWTNPYVTDGLVAMWDGIEHGGNELVWSDVTGHGFDATQRVNTGWSWSGNAYVSTRQLYWCGFTVPASLVDVVKNNINGHTIECVFKPSDNARAAIFGQYNGVVSTTRSGLNIEYSPHLAGSFRVYYDGNPDACISAWKSAGYVRLTCVAVCDGSQLTIFENGERKAAFTQPAASKIGIYPFIIGGENARGHMSINGSLYRVSIYSRALTPEEVRHNYNIDKARFNLP